jgi:purine-nucleoside phosphorylase
MTDSAIQLKNEKICNTLLGRQDHDMAIILITPLVSVYENLHQILNCNEEINDCFYRNATFKLKYDTQGMLVCVPQGIQAQDLMFALKPKKILFFGFAGSLKQNLTIGSILEVSQVVDETGNVIILEKTEKFNQVVCGFSPCLLGDVALEHYSIACNFDCHVIDMETVYCAKAAKKNGHEFSSWLLVTDIPGLINFWEIEDFERNLINKAFKIALSSIQEYCLDLQ